MEAFLEEFQHLKIQLEEIKSATGNFDNNKVIGKGGFGKVYEGFLSHSKGQSMVAFKRLDRIHGQGDPEFWKEILMLSRYTHENLISLLGFCDEDGEKILVYEHASHGSLDKHLGSPNLTWRQRLKICRGAAMGLSYLHDPKETRERVIHRDIKSSNILLDENWNAMVSDMGLSKIGPANQKHTFLVSNVVGTLGYVDPMYVQTSILTKESDVYSFGVVLLEVFCGRVCFEYENSHSHSLVQMWKQSYRQKKLDDIMFQDLKQHMDRRSLNTFADIAYRCLQISRAKRPTMSLVVEELNIALGLQEISEEAEYDQTAVPNVVIISKQELKMLLSKRIFLNEGNTWFRDICMWRNPTTTVLIHVLFILFVCYPELMLATVFLLMFLIGITNFRDRHMNTKISQAKGVQPDKLDKFHTSRRNPDLLQAFYNRLRSVGSGLLWIVVGDIAIQWDRMQSLVTWRDPQATAIFLTFCLVAIIVLLVTPLQDIAVVTGFYIMRHPRFRNHLPSVPVNFFRRLSTT